MGRLGFGEILLILGVALLLFGAGRISEIGKGLGEGIRNFKKGLREVEGDDAEDAPAPKALAKKKDDAPALTAGGKKKKVITVEVDDDEDEAEVVAKVSAAKKSASEDKTA
jgi:sec-independent protein translocase protein TatA